MGAFNEDSKLMLEFKAYLKRYVTYRLSMIGEVWGETHQKTLDDAETIYFLRNEFDGEACDNVDFDYCLEMFFAPDEHRQKEYF